jgi:hypothetical protein
MPNKSLDIHVEGCIRTIPVVQRQFEMEGSCHPHAMHVIPQQWMQLE